MKSRAASMTGVGLLYPNDFAISNAVSPLTSRCTTRRPSMSPPQQHCATSAESRIRADWPCCMDQWKGRTHSYLVLGSCDADGLRASQLQHAVEDVDGKPRPRSPDADPCVSAAHRRSRLWTCPWWPRSWRVCCSLTLSAIPYGPY